MKIDVKIKRVYEKPDSKDGIRILVDRLWPRGLTKEKAKVDLWLKEAAPSTELRKWFGHQAGKWSEFQKRYRAELQKNNQHVSLLKKAATQGPVTLLYAAKDNEHNEAIVLLDLLSSI
jgi:uncharacterized protein YeaO (DUF488 family)